MYTNNDNIFECCKVEKNFWKKRKKINKILKPHIRYSHKSNTIGSFGFFRTRRPPSLSSNMQTSLFFFLSYIICSSMLIGAIFFKKKGANFIIMFPNLRLVPVPSENRPLMSLNLEVGTFLWLPTLSNELVNQEMILSIYSSFQLLDACLAKKKTSLKKTSLCFFLCPFSDG